jgi:hypothetical protein
VSDKKRDLSQKEDFPDDQLKLKMIKSEKVGSEPESTSTKIKNTLFNRLSKIKENQSSSLLRLNPSDQTQSKETFQMIN